MSQNEIIKLTNVGVCYDGEVALRDVNISLYENDFVGIIGPNGGGKSSLVKAILGLIPYEGRVDIAPSIANTPIGYLPQQNHFDKQFPISVEELVLSGLQYTKGLKHRYTKQDKQQAKQILKELQIGDLSQKAVGDISGGQLQRALLGRAIISEPKLLILDEPANFVDNQFEKELYALLSELNRHMAIIMVSHDVGAITSIVKSVVCVNKTAHHYPATEFTPELLAEHLHNFV